MHLHTIHNLLPMKVQKITSSLFNHVSSIGNLPSLTSVLNSHPTQCPQITPVCPIYQKRLLVQLKKTFKILTPDINSHCHKFSLEALLLLEPEPFLPHKLKRSFNHSRAPFPGNAIKKRFLWPYQSTKM